MRKHLVYVAIGLLLAGCSALPSQVQGPKVAELKAPAASMADTASSFDVPSIKKGIDAAAIAGLYARSWRDAARERLTERDVLNNTQFGLTVAAAVNTARNAVTPAKWLLAGAGGTGLVMDRYQVEAQGTAYKQGAEAMECLRNELNLVPLSIWAQYDAEGELLSQALQSSSSEQAKVDETREAMEILLRVVHDRLRQAVNKVYDNVSSKVVRVPKADEISKAVSNEQKASSGSTDKAKAFNSARLLGMGNLDKAATTVPPVVPSAAAIKTALDLPGKLATCVATIP